MNGNNLDPLALKLRSTLFEIKRKGLCKTKQACTQGPLLGVTFMTKRYKSIRRLEAQHSHRVMKEIDQNQLSQQIFRRIIKNSKRKPPGLEISKAVIHLNEAKTNRISTQRSFDQVEESSVNPLSKNYLYKRLERSRHVLATHRNNQEHFRGSCTKSMYKNDENQRPSTAFTQLIIRKRGNKQKSLQMLAEKGDFLSGWNVENEQNNDDL